MKKKKKKQHFPNVVSFTNCMLSFYSIFTRHETINDNQDVPHRIGNYDMGNGKTIDYIKYGGLGQCEY